MLQLYNSLSQKKELFKPINNKQVTMYVCGITPYDTTHLGHAFTYLSFDILVRYLRYLNYQTTYTQNVTDINDRDNDILKRAEEQQVAWQDLARFWTEKFLRDMQALNWMNPDNYLKASEQISSMIYLIENIIANGFGYVINGGVYLGIEKVKDFGKLSRLSKEQMLIKAKEFEEDITNPDKRHPLDITLWRPSRSPQPAHIPSFDSPWGKGRPGWHIECSAMAISSLGEQIDIHGGGIDLIYPHHESEIAQSESATLKKPFAKYWLHTGTVHINGQKMSKSLGNLILVSDLRKTYSPNAIRWALLSHHYRAQWSYNKEEFDQAEQIVEKIAHADLSNDQVLLKHCINALNNDLDVPTMLDLVIQTIERTNSIPSNIKDLLTILGFAL